MEISIVVLIYNQRNTIRAALDSILCQQCSLPYEIILGDDGSTDGTREILREYAARYPTLIRFRSGNHLGIKRNLVACLQLCTGSYIAFLEGDDFWTDPHKLEKQISFLKTHPAYVAVYHGYSNCNQNGNDCPELPARFCSGEYTLQDYRKFLLPSQSSTLLMRNICPALLREHSTEIHRVRFMPPDRLGPLLLLTHGKLFCLPEIMSRRRKILCTAGSNWSSLHRMGHNPNYLYRFMIYREMDLLLVRMGAAEAPDSFWALRQEMYAKSRRAILRESNRFWMWFQGIAMRLLEPAKRETTYEDQCNHSGIQ